ncbi:putative 4-hydroxy-4-methyl-2-oxoglutarate aldolase [Aliagarivorans marinus]|uniref:putative 4-hydroxy-4-methyl-2-oxoglutarate aldolase n=1 Tax=Aliagarivorans marinus TaxID=561965 RepID=UPI00042A7174|nr:putative 4-hydroxy-4-methyl-2-oxoglutarate aldolase [Aliagarivorans marinus]
MDDILPDLFDEYPDKLQLIAGAFAVFGGLDNFQGQVVTVSCYEDNSRVKELLAQEGEGKVLVVDGGASLRRALMGDLIAANAVENSWVGVVINGAIRDVAAISTMPLGVRALGACPIKTERKGLGEVNVTVAINGVIIEPGVYLYADLNGIAISKEKLI